MTRDGRAQLVLAAAAVVAVALAPLVFAYLQLGYHGDVNAGGPGVDPSEKAERVLSRAVQEAAADIPGRYDWAERSAAVRTVRTRLTPTLDTLRSSRVASGTAYSVGYNRSAANRWRRERCPRGPDRQFGDCEATNGIVVQNRSGETHVVAVAFDVVATTERGEIELTTVVRVR